MLDFATKSLRLLSPLVIVIVMGFPGGASGKEDVSNVDSISGLGRSSGVGMAPHSSILAWRIPWIEEPSGLQSMGS